MSAEAIQTAHGDPLPKRTNSQRIGDLAEFVVRKLIQEHSYWLARSQDQDFGVDLEAELTEPDGADQQLSGKLIKIQIKGSRSWKVADGYLNVVLKRSYLDYVGQFRLPAILVAVDVTTSAAWYVWLQDWILRHEQELNGTAASAVIVTIPDTQMLTDGLDGPLQSVARGENDTAMVLALRELGAAAVRTRNAIVFEKLLDILYELDEPSKTWITHKTVDALLAMGPHSGMWEAHAMLPLLFALIDKIGDQLAPSQISRLVIRSDGYSRTGIYALSRLYDRRPASARALSLPDLFDAEGLHEVAWYCRFREHHEGRDSIAIFDCLRNSQPLRTQFGALKLPNSPGFASEIVRRWPNRGDSFYLERLQSAESESDASACSS